MIIQNVKIRSFCVLKDTISISVSTDDTQNEVIDELKKMQTRHGKYWIESSITKSKGNDKKGLYIDARVKSLSLSGTVSFTLHTAIQRFVIFRLLDIKASEGGTVIKFISHTESLLQQFMEEASRKFDISPEEALRRVTTFPGKRRPDEMVPGKRSIYELSERHKQVAVDKLRKMLKGPQRIVI